jgi:hypothetical protein
MGEYVKPLIFFGGCNCGKASTYVFAERLIRNAENTLATKPTIPIANLFTFAYQLQSQTIAFVPATSMAMSGV